MRATTSPGGLYAFTLQAFSFAANNLHVPDIAKDAGSRWVDAGHELGEDWIGRLWASGAGCRAGPAGQHVHGELVLVEAADLAERCGAFWAAAYAQFVLAQSVLRRARTDPESERLGLDALVALRRASPVVSAGRGTSRLSVVALYLGSDALAVAGRASEATRLRDAVHDHAQMLGVPLEVLPPPRLHGRRPGVWRLARCRVEGRQCGRRDGDRDHAGAPPSWADMVELLTPP